MARLAPLASQQYPVFPEYDLALQRRVMQIVAEHTDVPGARVVAWYEPDAAGSGLRSS